MGRASNMQEPSIRSRCRVPPLFQPKVVEGAVDQPHGLADALERGHGVEGAELAQRVIHHLKRHPAPDHVVRQVGVPHGCAHGPVIEPQATIGNVWITRAATRHASSTMRYGRVPQLAASSPVIGRPAGSDVPA